MSVESILMAIGCVTVAVSLVKRGLRNIDALQSYLASDSDDPGDMEWCQWCNEKPAIAWLESDDAACAECYAANFEPCPSCRQMVRSDSLRASDGAQYCLACGPDWDMYEDD